MDFKIYEIQMNEEKESVFKWMHNEFAKLRTGRATPAILDGILVDYYGTPTPINQLANISVVDARSLMIKPYDKNSIKDINTAINAANIGINPLVDADVIRLNFPAPTEDLRKELAKKAKQVSEEAKVKVRKIRQNLQDEFKKDVTALEDDKKFFQTKLDELTKKVNKEIEELLANKEKDILTI
ncbi:ribosome recycling factor [Ureaplasma zalophigenitalium]|uniref:Ribosome-recycling factor n=1 Tax=Ureaplasma zalophigenitalium TaxID=907723 RepID=A0ABT3BNR9_9BACT|nr:ribosome recycling factor [Ureaplasma zalophigenitalium]MCV3753905.1 ribosome recycling factor [Ureaplasma zalophigenitalium]